MKKILIFCGILLFFIGLFLIQNAKNNISVFVEFQKLRPIKGRVNIYYNGFEIGKMKKMDICENSKNVCANIILNEKKMFLPENIEVLMKQKLISDNKYEDYMEIIYPETPAYKKIENGKRIKGTLAGGFRNYVQEEIKHDEMEVLKNRILSTADNFEKASSILVELLSTINEIAENTKDNINSGTSNLNKTIQNLNSLTGKINASVNQETLNDIMKEFGYSIHNFKDSTEYIKNMTFDMQSYGANIGGILNSTGSVTENLEEILCGVNCSLSKPFGGLRILFGKTTGK